MMVKFSHKAFTLLELMVAVVILLVVISGCLLTYIYCILLNETSHNLAVAVNDAQFVLEQIKSLAYSDIAAYAPPPFNNLPGEAVTLNRAITAHMSTITVNVGWEEKQRARNLSFTTYVAK